MHGTLVRLTVLVLYLFCGFVPSSSAAGADLSEEVVLRSIERAKKFLSSHQNADGSWPSRLSGEYQIGVSSLALLALVNAGMTRDDTPVAKGLRYLRSVREPNPTQTYEISLMIMALAAAKDGVRDNPRLAALAQKLEQGQVKRGDDAGMWSYDFKNITSLDHSNTQFAILGLRDAAMAGVAVDRSVWERSRRHWLNAQNPDGGWGYSRSSGQNSTGSMTVAGVASLVVTRMMLPDDSDVRPDGTPDCCLASPSDAALKRGVKWLERHFAVGHNPNGGVWELYYLYGLERAGRLSGRRFFGKHDWYREGAKYLIGQQSARSGEWQGSGLEADPVVATSFALLFLSKGLAPVLMNKLQFGDSEDANLDVKSGAQNWNLHPSDARNLTDWITGLPKWPKLLTWQVVDVNRILEEGGVIDLMQSPILYLSGRDAIKFDEPAVKLLKEFVDNGGFVFAVNCCNGSGFEETFRQLIHRMYPEGFAELRPLPPEHPIYRSEYLLPPGSAKLWGVDFGCRTAIVYSPDDLACLWNKWSSQNVPKRSPELNGMITKSMRVGVNVVAYATGREPPDKLKERELTEPEEHQDLIERGLLQIAKLRHNGNWDAAPRALHNLLLALNRTVGLAASTHQSNLLADDPNIFKYPIVYMHGQEPFQLNAREREQLVRYLKQGGVLFADACCGASQFDQSFRQLMRQMFPNQPFERIPLEHELFTTKVGHDLSQVRRRSPQANNPTVPLETFVKSGRPFLEGIDLEGRYAVIYSKYDISCALEHQASVACAGYVPEDAVKIAVNVIQYAMMQDVDFDNSSE